MVIANDYSVIGSSQSLLQMSDHKKSSMLECSKVAFINYLSEQKTPKHNYQKRSIFWDREHVYNENLMLRNKIKELEEINTKTQTRLLKSEKDVATLSHRSMSKIKSSSLFRSTSTSQINPQVQLFTMKWKVDALKEQEHHKTILVMKKNIRQLKQTIENLTFQNNELKKSIKYTRMSELQTQNKELLQEVCRLKNVINQNMRIREEMTKVFAEEKKDFRLTMQKEVMEKSRISKQLKKMQDQMQEMSRVTRTAQPMKKKNKPLEKAKNAIRINVQTTQSKLLQSNASGSREDLVRLEYSQSAFSEAHNKPATGSNNHKKSTEQLTSLELLTLKSPADEDFSTPQKDPEPQHQEPASEPIIVKERQSKEVMEDIPKTQSKSPLKNEAIAQKPVNPNQIVEQEYLNDSEEYEDLMEYESG